MRRLIALVTVSTMTLLGLVAVGGPANAAFPGKNGRIAFSTDFSRPPQIYTTRPDGTGVRQLTHFASGSGGATNPEVSPDGSRILFVHRGQIWIMNADGSEEQQLTGQTGFADQQPSWSPDGARVVFSHCAVPFGFVAYCDIDAMNLNGTHVTKILGGNWSHSSPEYSPDGSRIVFNSDRGGYVSAVWVMTANGGGPQRLTKPSMEAWGPDWSPDGSRIIFSDNAERPHTNVWGMRADGSDLTELTHFPVGHQGGYPSYSPDGRKIVLISDLAYPDACCNDLDVMNADGSNLHTIVTNQPTVFATDWGPAVTP